MKLYFATGTCSLSPHIVIREAGLDVALEQVDHRKKVLKSDGSDFLAINPKGMVPVLELDDGARLTEGPVIVQYLADRKPAAGLLPPAGSLARYKVQEWLNYITSELHKTYTPLFNKAVPEEFKAMARAQLGRQFDWLDKQLAGKTWLMGDAFTVADIYLFTVLRWSPFVGVEIGPRPNLEAFVARMRARPSVQKVMEEEGLKA